MNKLRVATVGIAFGLGLALSRDLAHHLNGSLDVKSELGKGSVFTLSLPLERQQSAS